jgi:hypothetical protein
MIELIQFFEALDQLCHILFTWNFLMFLSVKWARTICSVFVSQFVLSSQTTG